MAKKFCTTGTCIPEKNYMVDLSNRIQQIINQYIESGQYFTINRARQYGKTTLLREWVRYFSDRGFTAAIADERSEIAALADGVPQLAVGR